MRWFNPTQVTELKKITFTDEDIFYFESRIMPALEFHLRSPRMADLNDEFHKLQNNLEITLEAIEQLIRSEQYENEARKELYNLIIIEDIKLHHTENTLQEFLKAGHRLNILLNKKIFPKIPKEKTIQKSASPYLIQIIHEGLIKIGKDFPPSRSKTSKFYIVSQECWIALGKSDPERAVRSYIDQLKTTL